MQLHSSINLDTLMKFGSAAALILGTAAQPQYLGSVFKPGQSRRDKALNRAYQRAYRHRVRPYERFVILSDQHKGARDLADDFQQCETTYLTALDYYYQSGYILVILGDAEELWEQGVKEVLDAYENVLSSEGRFYPGRYLRIYGNHDNLWRDPAKVRQYMEPFFPDIKVYEGLILEISDLPDQQNGQIVLLHGHQGTLDSDIFDFLPPLVLPLYRIFQNLTGFGRTTPAQDACLRSLQDTQMYRWVRTLTNTILIAGHTHRPVWSSMTHLEKLLWQFHELLDLEPDQRPGDYHARVAELLLAIEEREKSTPPCDDTIKTRPCYFNTGCCRFADGDITGIEIENGLIRLIKWGQNKSEQAARQVLEQTYLAALFAVL